MMPTCSELSDRMPDVAHGPSGWTELEERHLAACADCRAEWRIVTAVARLGDSLPPPADPTLVSRLLLERLGRERRLVRRRTRLWTAAGLAGAAVIVALWTGGRGVAGPGTGPDTSRAPALATAPAEGRAELSLPEIDDLPADALDSILRVLDEPAARADAYELPGLGDPGDRELEQALTGLEG
jgi:hypothetical protein